MQMSIFSFYSSVKQFVYGFESRNATLCKQNRITLFSLFECVFGIVFPFLHFFFSFPTSIGGRRWVLFISVRLFEGHWPKIFLSLFFLQSPLLSTINRYIESEQQWENPFTNTIKSFERPKWIEANLIVLFGILDGELVVVRVQVNLIRYIWIRFSEQDNHNE